MSRLAEMMQKRAELDNKVELFDHQKEVVDRIRNNKNTIIAHAVGSGKTLSAIAGFEALKADGKAHKALVVTPASLRENFAVSGVRKFTHGERVNIVGNKAENIKGHELYNSPDPDADYNVVSYELFRRDPRSYFKATGADTAIFDELHRGKNITKTYEAIRDSRDMYDNFIGATGSIVSNKITDVLPLIDAATSGKQGMTKTPYVSEFESTYFVRSKDKKYKDKAMARRPIVGLRNREQLKRFLGNYVDYRDFDDIKDTADMPGRDIVNVPVPITEGQSKAYHRLVRQDKKLYELVAKRRYEYLKDSELATAFNTMAESRKLMNDPTTYKPGTSLSEAAAASPKVQQMITDMKADKAANPRNKSVVTSFLIRGGTDIAEQALKDNKIEYGSFLGKGNEGVTEESRQLAVADYNKDKLKTMVLSGAGGEGLSLNDTTNMYMMDMHFNPERNSQMVARGIRSGSLKYLPEEARSVHARRYIATMPKKKFLFFKWKDSLKTPDEVIYDIAAKKDSQNKLLQDLLKEDRRKFQ